MTDANTSDVEHPKPLDTLLKLSLPVLAALGGAYLVGFFSRVELRYLTFVDAQDFIITSLYFVPPFLAAFAMGQLFRYMRDANRAEPEIPIIVQILRRPDGTWRKWHLRIFNVMWFVFTLLPLVYMYCIIRRYFDISIVQMMFATLSAILTVNEYATYRVYRYGTGEGLGRLVSGMALLILVFGIGYSNAQVDELGTKPTARLIYKSGEVAEVNGARRVGDSVIYYNTASKVWELVSRSEILKVVALRDQSDATSQPADSSPAPSDDTRPKTQLENLETSGTTRSSGTADTAVAGGRAAHQDEIVDPHASNSTEPSP